MFSMEKILYLLFLYGNKQVIKQPSHSFSPQSDKKASLKRVPDAGCCTYLHHFQPKIRDCPSHFVDKIDFIEV